MQKLYRPVGFKELDLILNTGCRRYPKRLPTQPIFYLVLNQQYAIEIARKWNTIDNKSRFSGYVTEFYISREYISEFEPHIVGGMQHKELWIPADKLLEFNSKIVIPIRISHAFYGKQYVGNDNSSNYNDYIEQFIFLKNLKNGNLMDFSCNIQYNRKIITLNYIAWQNYNDTQKISLEEKQKLLYSVYTRLSQN